jgi:ubiquinone biosynthesis monooxygenase Coq6
MVPIRVAGVQDGSRASFPLSMKHSDTYISERVALVGDAGHTTHPLAGQGLNMGQSDVSSLVAALQDASIRCLDIGSPLALEPFWKAAYLSNHLKLGVFDKLHKLYSTDFGPIVALRSWGLSAVNQSSIVKRFLMHNASNF